jgi:hypothetical protein
VRSGKRKELGKAHQVGNGLVLVILKRSPLLQPVLRDGVILTPDALEIEAQQFEARNDMLQWPRERHLGWCGVLALFLVPVAV